MEFPAFSPGRWLAPPQTIASVPQHKARFRGFKVAEFQGSKSAP